MLVIIVAVIAALEDPDTAPRSAAGPKSQASATLQAGRARVRSLAWAPDGTTLAAAIEGGEVGLVTIAGGLDRTIPPGSSPRDVPGGGLGPSPLAWSADGTTLATAEGPEVILRGAADGRARASFRLDAPGVHVQSLAFSPGGDLAAGGDDGSVILWDTKRARVRTTLRAHAGAVNGLAFAPDGRTVASGSSDGKLCIWDADTGRLRGSAATPLGMASLAFAPDGLTIVTGGTYLMLWDAATARLRLVLDRDGGFCSAPAYSPDGRRLAAASPMRGTIRIWDTATFRALATFQGRVTPVFALAFAPDGRTLAAGGEDGMIESWTVAEVLGRAPAG
jgi:hypothetical protein